MDQLLDQILTENISAFELMYRVYEGAPVTGAQVLSSLANDLARGRLVGHQTILALVAGNPDMNVDEIQTLIGALRQAIFRYSADRPAEVAAYRRALDICESELMRANHA